MSDDPAAAADKAPQAGAPTSSGAGAGAEGRGGGEPSEEELRAAYEAELSRISSTDMVMQAAVSLLNIGGRRLGLAGGGESERDLEQVRDAIDGVRGLLPVLERRLPGELRPLRDALSQLQMAYAREAGASGAGGASEQAQVDTGDTGGDTPAGAPPRPAGGAGQAPPGAPQSGAGKPGPGPAESSGRLWVPGR
jgi:hypothetical protein